MKSIETILMLSKNPHYKLSSEEVALLRKYQAEKAMEESVVNRNVVDKHDTTVKKNNKNIEE